jgi:ABC-type polar amino acid transport system ATPase subunit
MGLQMTAEVKIKCRNIWKIFGADPKGFLARHDGNPTQEALKEAGYIGACQDVSFDVHAGEILIIMGLSGSGKSTMVRCITRLNDPTSGEVEFEGKNLLQATEKELIEIRRHKFGMVFQNFGLLPHRDVLSNVAFPLEVQGIPRAQREARAAEMVELVGLKGREAYFPRELSGGQQQRVGIARSLAVEPDVWFLDEPFSALDGPVAPALPLYVSLMTLNNPWLGDHAARIERMHPPPMFQGQPLVETLQRITSMVPPSPLREAIITGQLLYQFCGIAESHGLETAGAWYDQHITRKMPAVMATPRPARWSWPFPQEAGRYLIRRALADAGHRSSVPRQQPEPSQES